MCARQPDNKPDDLLERAIASLNDRADAALQAAPVPTPQAIRQTLQRLNAAEQAAKPQTFSWTPIMSKPIFRFSVAAAIVVALAGAFWFVVSGSGNIAFGDVLANVKDIKSVSYKMTGTINVAGQGPMAINSDVLIAEPSRMRQVNQPAGIIMIWDFNAGKMLTLVPAQKMATVMNITQQPKQANTANVLEQLKHLDSNAFEPVPGEKTIDNHVVVGFKPMGEAANSLMWQTFWVDKQTRLPVQIDVNLPNGVIGEGSMVMKDFKWDVPVDQASLSLTPPAGYTVQATTMDATPATEAEFIDALRCLAELNNNIFPDTPDLANVSRLTAASMAKQMVEAIRGGGNRGDVMKAAQEKMTPLMTRLTRAIFFPANAANGTDFHYAGKGVALVEANKPIFWYRPKDSQTCRVVYADLTVRDVKPNELPKVESIPLGAPIGTPNPPSK